MSGADPHHFDFDLDRGIRSQVVEKLEASPIFPLSKGVGPAASGIYALYFCDAGVKGSTLTPLDLDLFGNITNWPADFFGDQFAELAATQEARLNRMTDNV